MASVTVAAGSLARAVSADLRGNIHQFFRCMKRPYCIEERRSRRRVSSSQGTRKQSFELKTPQINGGGFRTTRDARKRGETEQRLFLLNA